MKLLTTIFFAFFIMNCSYAQLKKNIFFEQATLIKKFHTIEELENLKKGQLISLYTNRVNEVITVLPYLALTNEAGVKLSDIGIKENSDNLRALNKHHGTNTEMLESSKNMISEFIPYADTEKIIWAILYFEEVIKKVRIGANGNF
ncbi:hypothetical protein [Aquimarina sp. I32.4]|uniref:hypothetical protein n=1 Tax=Aquimarina sp. I32.4 TaxID=2053903 RepID=UPI000CDE5AB3|nr:hypothetical protein [Aquimarina sp. I32.4]